MIKPFLVASQDYLLILPLNLKLTTYGREDIFI